MPKQLTAAAVLRLRPDKERQEISDSTPGLFLVIHPTGHKSWVMRFRRPNGKHHKLTLGTHDVSGQELEGAPEIGQPLTLRSARWLAAEVNRQRAMGRDPVADLEATRNRRRVELQTKAYTFSAAATQFIDEHARKNNRGWRATAKMLGLDYSEQVEVIKDSLADRWQKRAITEISRDDISEAVDEAMSSGIPGMGRRTHGISNPRGRAMARALSKMFSWLLQRRKIKTNPCLGMFVPPSSKARDRVLTNDELRNFWAATETLNPPFSALFRLLLLTGQRRNEVAGMTLSELSEDGATWEIPAARTKNKLKHVVPLSPLARELIASVGQVGHHVFTTNGRTPVAGFFKLKLRLDLAMQKEAGEEFVAWRLHDLRRTAVTGMYDLGVAPHHVEAVVNHISGHKSGVAGTYNRAKYSEEKRVALERWAARVEGLVADRKAKVVSIRGGKK